MEPVSGPTFDASTPPFAQTKPWGVSVMITPRVIRMTRRASLSTTSTWRGSRSQRRPNSRASVRGSIVVRSTIAPSALDTIFWVTTTTSPGWKGRTPVVRSTASATIDGRSSPGRISGMPSSASTPKLADRRRRGRRTGPVEAWLTGNGVARVGRLRRLVRERFEVDEQQIVRRVEVDRERAVDLDEPRPGVACRLLVAAPAGMPERERDGRRRRDDKRIRARPVAVGNERDERVALAGRGGGPPEERVDLVGCDQRQVRREHEQGRRRRVRWPTPGRPAGRR